MIPEYTPRIALKKTALSFEPVWLTYSGQSILFPAIYTPNTQFDRVRFQVGVNAARLHRPENDLILPLVEQFTNEHGILMASRPTRPEVECNDIPRLVEMLTGLDARNINRDRIFAECPLVSIAVSPYYYDLRGSHTGYALTLHKIKISLPHVGESLVV